MMRHFARILLTLTAILTTVVATAQIADNNELPSIQLKEFNSLRIDAKMELTLVTSQENTVDRLVYDLADNDPEKFKCEVNDKKRLVISQSKGTRSVTPIRATLYCRDLESISIARADVKFASQFTHSILDVKVEAEGRLTGSISCDDLLLSTLSDSQVELTGSVRYLTIKATMGSRNNLRGVDAISTKVEASHGAVVGIDAGERVDISASTKAVVKYWNTPKILRINQGVIGGKILKQDE